MTRDPDQPLPGSEDEERRYLAIGGLDPTDASVAGLLLDARANPNDATRDGTSALMLATINGRFQTLDSALHSPREGNVSPQTVHWKVDHRSGYVP